MRYFQGGGNYGIIPTYVDELIEDLTQLPLHESFNMFAGSSIGSQHASALNMPKTKGSREAKMTARGFRYTLMEVSRQIFPHKSHYYLRQAAAEIPKLIHEFFVKAEELGAEKLDKTLNRNINRIRRVGKRSIDSIQKLSLKPLTDDGYNSESSDDLKRSYPVAIHPFRSFYKRVLLPLNNLIDRGLEYLLEKSRYDIDDLHHILKVRFSDPVTGEEPTLEDSLISQHVTSYNFTVDEPAYFFHYRDPVNLKSKHVSDPGLRVSDMLCRSSAAQTVFQPFKGDNGDIYFDIAHFDNASSATSDLQGHLPARYRPKIVIAGTGARDYNMDASDLRNMLFIRQLAGPMGAALLGIPQKHIMRKEMKDLARDIGEENIVNINRSLSSDEHIAKYERLREKGAFRTLVSIFGSHAIRESVKNELENIPDFAMFDSRDRQLRTMNKFGFATAWENAVEIVKISRELVENAEYHKRISPEEARQRLEAIDSLFEDDNQERPSKAGKKIAANQNTSPRPEEIRVFREEMYRKWPFLEDLKTYFNATGTSLNDYDKTPFVPLRFGEALSDPKELEQKPSPEDQRKDPDMPRASAA